MDDAVSGQVSFLEIGARDAAETLAFFAAAFDWPAQEGGWLQTPALKAGVHGDDPAPQIYVYFKVADMQAAMDRIKAAGGEADEPTIEPGFGRFSNCRGPGGLRFGLHDPAAG